jgi:glutaminase
MDYQKILNDVYKVVSSKRNSGLLASYIPELAKVNPEKFGIYLTTVNNEEFGIGDYSTKFSIQSIAKVLTLTLAYKILGQKIWKRVGVEPSGTPFNSLVQLEADKGIPRNPLINAGAMVICDILVSNFQDPKKEFLTFIREISNNPTIDYSNSIIESERSAGYRNIALCNYIKSFDTIKNKPEDVLDFYFSICSIELNCAELSKLFLLFANHGVVPYNNETILTISQTKRINSIMQTCGFYDESGEFTFKVGLPGKSGVGGGIIAIHPNNYCIATWSPKLNEKGNSHRGMKFLELLTTKTQSSIF